MLRAILYKRKKEETDSARAPARRLQVGSGDRSEKIRTYNFPQSRVTDHRIGFSLYDIAGFMNGNLDPMIRALTEADTAARLRESEARN